MIGLLSIGLRVAWVSVERRGGDNLEAWLACLAEHELRVSEAFRSDDGDIVIFRLEGT